MAPNASKVILIAFEAIRSRIKNNRSEARQRATILGCSSASSKTG